MPLLILFELKHVRKEGIILCHDDAEDMTEVISVVSHQCPQFKDLIANQLRNAKSVDPRQRRWDPALISLALNIYAK